MDLAVVGRKKRPVSKTVPQQTHTRSGGRKSVLGTGSRAEESGRNKGNFTQGSAVQRP